MIASLFTNDVGGTELLKRWEIKQGNHQTWGEKRCCTHLRRNSNPYACRFVDGLFGILILLLRQGTRNGFRVLTNDLNCDLRDEVPKSCARAGLFIYRLRL